VPPREWKLRVRDMLDAIETIGEYASEHDLASFREDRKTIDAVVYRFVVLGEAASALPDDVRGRQADVPWDEIRGLRNVVVHEYTGVRIDTVWQTICEDLPPLVPLLEAMLEEAS